MSARIARVQSGFKVDADEGAIVRFGEVEVIVRATAQDSGGAFSLFEEVDPADTPLHVHEREDELFYVLEGFFFELAEADRAGDLGPDAYARASKRYGITWLDE